MHKRSCEIARKHEVKGGKDPPCTAKILLLSLNLESCVLPALFVLEGL